jgi:hypothetical protein
MRASGRTLLAQYFVPKSFFVASGKICRVEFPFVFNGFHKLAALALPKLLVLAQELNTKT